MDTTKTTDPVSELEQWAIDTGGSYLIDSDTMLGLEVILRAAGVTVIVSEYPNKESEADYHSGCGERHVMAASRVYGADPHDRSPALRPGLRGCVSVALRQMKACRGGE